MRRLTLILSLATLLPGILCAQTPVQPIRVPIEPIVAKYGLLGSVSLVDTNHLLLDFNNKCPHKDNYGCNMHYVTLDLKGHELGSLPVGLSQTLEILPDGHLFLHIRDKDQNRYQILDKNLSVVEQHPCESQYCGEELKSRKTPSISTTDATSCHSAGNCGVHDIKPTSALYTNPLVAKAAALNAIYLLAVNRNELWFMDRHSGIYYLTTSSSEPKPIPGFKWSSFGKDACNMGLYGSDPQRVFATCPQVIPLDFDDAISLFTQVAVFDVKTHTVIARRTGDSYFLSPDGHTLGHREKNKFVVLEPLP